MLSDREALSRASHELRTPLNAILGFGQLLALDPLSDGQRHSVEQIIAGGRHLLSLVEDLLDLSSVGELSIGPVMVAEEIAHAVALSRPLAAERSLAVDVEVLEPTLTAHVDARRLQQILLNLISNAIKYNRPGGSLTVHARPDGDDRVSIEVRDTGRGLTEAELARLFVPFERLDAARRGIEGNGLGLALSRALAEAMDGTIEVASTPDEGSVFTLRLPASSQPGTPPRGTERQLAGVA
ncbi:MAG: HAMP domain-containing histidine kinase [Solirubrobacterales bacterium]|nr:HAMP domain-containing histidine kinase [Solirubrobacterales bacterium]